MSLQNLKDYYDLCFFTQMFSRYLWIRGPYVDGYESLDIPTYIKENLFDLSSDETLRLQVFTDFWLFIHKKYTLLPDEAGKCHLHSHLLIHVK
jgi:hypothetical protein